MRLAIIGAGVIGTIHARLIESLGAEATLAAVIDTEFERAEQLAAAYAARPYASAADAYRAEVIDAVAVCLPSALHTDVAVEALEAGKHVLIEKPIATTLADADRIVAAERASGRTVAVISQRRFQTPAVTIKAAIASGRLGNLTSGLAESALYRPQEYYDSGDWRGTLAIDGGGALMNQGIHALDLLIWMLGEPTEVSAQTASIAHERIEVEDVAAATVRFRNGAIGVMLASTAAKPGLPVRIAVHGDRGTAVMVEDELAVFEADPDSGAGEPSTNSPAPEPPTLADWSDIDRAHRAQYADFVEAVRTGRPPAVTTEDGRTALAVVLAVYESARRGAPVSIDGAAR